jgi:hypothetical protein
MVHDEPQAQDIPGDPKQTSSPFQKPGSKENFRFRQREPDDRTGLPGTGPGKDTDLKEREGGSDDEEDPGSERPSSRQRHHRGGRPEKRVIEESAYDPYCE